MAALSMTDQTKAILEAELIKDISANETSRPLTFSPRNSPLGSIEGEAGGDERGRAGEKLDIEAEVGMSSKSFTSIYVSRTVRAVGRYADLIIDVLSELLPIPWISAVDVGG